MEEDICTYCGEEIKATIVYATISSKPGKFHPNCYKKAKKEEVEHE